MKTWMIVAIVGVAILVGYFLFANKTKAATTNYTQVNQPPRNTFADSLSQILPVILQNIGNKPPGTTSETVVYNTGTSVLDSSDKQDVMDFQGWHNSKGYNPRLVVDGVYGPMTSAAYVKYGGEWGSSKGKTAISFADGTGSDKSGLSPSL